MMIHLMNFVLTLRKDKRAQDLIEYALMAGFIAVAAGAVMPGVAGSVKNIFNGIQSVLGAAPTSMSS